MIKKLYLENNHERIFFDRTFYLCLLLVRRRHGATGKQTKKGTDLKMLHLIVQIINSFFISLFTKLVSLSSLIDKKYVLIMMMIIIIIIIIIIITTQLFDVNCNDSCN